MKPWASAQRLILELTIDKSLGASRREFAENSRVSQEGICGGEAGGGRWISGFTGIRRFTQFREILMEPEGSACSPRERGRNPWFSPLACRFDFYGNFFARGCVVEVRANTRPWNLVFCQC